jgi:hypothetical protein
MLVTLGDAAQAALAGGAFAGLVLGSVWLAKKAHYLQTNPEIEDEWKELERFGARREQAHRQATGRVWYEKDDDTFYERRDDNSIRKLDA